MSKQTPLLSAVLTADRSLTDRNSAFDRFFEIDTPADQPISAKQIFRPEELIALRSGKPATVKLGDRWIRMQKQTDNDDGGIKITGVEVTDLKRAIERADAAADSKSSFLATISHEIRTPMQSIFGLLELMDRQNPGAEIEKMIHTAKHSASGLLELLDDVLDLAKVEAGKMDLDPYEIPVRTLIYGILEAMEVKAAEKDLTLYADIDEEVPFVIYGDPKRLRQILINLIGNALKFTREGGVTLRLSTQAKMVEPPTENHLVLRFEIIDTGIGMDQETADKLFTPFTQADNTTTREFGGTGLGLSISHRLVNLMDGKIGVDSAPGKGSKFWVEIPTTESSMNIYDDLPDLDGIAVLSVEDHPAGAKEINRTLTSMGAKVETANTFSDGLKLITKRPYDVAVIDHGLPDGDGLDLLRQTSDLRPFTGLVLYTVHDSQLIQQTTKSLGATYLSKPASRIGLGKAVKQAARQRVSPKFSGPRRLLLAEDNDTVRDVLGQQLDQFGITVDFADNGVEALSMLEDDEYGILMTDLHMPKMDGYGLVKKIRAEEEKQNLPHRPVIAITADVQLMQNQRYLSHGFDECLLKPVTIGQLQRLLMRWGIITDQKTKNKRLNNKDQKNDPGISDKKTILDRQAIARQFGGMNDMTINILQKFVDLAGQQIDDLQDGINNKEIDRVAEIAHSLKGGAHSAGAVMVGDLAAEVQKLAEKTDDPDIQKMIGVLMVLKDAYRTVSDEIDGLSSN